MSPTIEELNLGVSEFVALLNQTLDIVYPSVTITGELANLRVSKGKWLYFDLKDDAASVKFFGTIYNLPGPLEDGMLLKVRGAPRLHHLYGFSVNVQSIQPAGEGSIKKAAQLLEAKLMAEGLFDEARKRTLPYPPERIGLITSRQAAAYADFTKILNARWGGLEVILADVQVQGEPAVEQIVRAVESFNALAEPPDVLVMIRGGGSPEDLAAFSSEQVTRAVAASRVPTMVAIGHESDISLAELAADRRASTPSNAAELLVPDKKQLKAVLKEHNRSLSQGVQKHLHGARQELRHAGAQLAQAAAAALKHQRVHLYGQLQLLNALSPAAVLNRGYAIVRRGDSIVRGAAGLSAGDIVNIELIDSLFDAQVRSIEPKKKGKN